MEKESIELVLSRFDALAAKIGTTTEQIWPWLIKQQYVIATCNLLMCLLSIAVTVALCMYIKKNCKDISQKFNEMSYDAGSMCKANFYIALIVMTFIASIITIFITISAIESLPRIFNPEYYALQALTSMLKP